MAVRFRRIPQIFLLAAIAFASSCTKSPFDESEIAAKRTQISGQVLLEDGLNPAGTFIWFTGFKMTERADSSGAFAFTIPPKNLQAGPAAVDGVFTLYFYMANYGLDSAKVIVRNGEFAYGIGDLADDGSLDSRRVLEKFLRINTSISPAMIREDFTGVIEVTFEFSLAPGEDSVTVVFPHLSEATEIAAIFLERQTQGWQLLRTPLFLADQRSDAQQVTDSTSVSLTLEYNWIPGQLPAGEYEVVPHVLVHHEKLPPGLLQAMGLELDELGESYLRFPIKREGQRLRVLPADQ